MNSPKSPAGDTVFHVAATNRFGSYGPRKELPKDDRGISAIEPCEPQEADFWSIYMFVSFADPADPSAGIWEWVADYDTEQAVKAFAHIATTGGQ